MQPNQPPWQYQPPWPYPPPPPTNGMGIAGFVLGLLCVLTFPTGGLAGLLGVLGIVFGSIGRGQSARLRRMPTGLATAGLTLGIIGLCLAVLFSMATANRYAL
jgi:hypothetical protein